MSAFSNDRSVYTKPLVTHYFAGFWKGKVIKETNENFLKEREPKDQDKEN